MKLRGIKDPNSSMITLYGLGSFDVDVEKKYLMRKEFLDMIKE
jgi:GTP cyclohydrolase I